MVQKRTQCIRFINRWRGREPGQIDRELSLGVMDTLVATKKAEWHDQESEPKGRKKRESVPAV